MEILLSPFGSVGVIVGGGLRYYIGVITTEILENRDEIFDDMATNEDQIEKWNVRIKYKYKRHRSNDGAWVLMDIRVDPL